MALLLVGVAGARVGVPDAVGELALENLQAGHVARHERHRLIEFVYDVEAGAGADEIVRIGDNTPVHLMEEICKLPLADIVEVDHDRVQIAGVATVAALTVVAHRRKEHERVLFD